MKRPQSIGKEPSLQRIVIASAILHIFFIILVTIPFKTREREFKSYFVNLVTPVEIHRWYSPPLTREGRKTTATKKRILAKKRVAARKKKVITQKTLKTGPGPKADILRPSDDRVAKEIERIRAISALSKQKREREKAQQIEIIRKKVYESFSEGSGIPSVKSHEISDSYYALITQKIWSQWIYPDIETAGLEVIISIKINSDGNVISHEIEKSSGNMLFDHSAIKAILKASPLPPPLVEMEIGMRFRP